MSSYLTRLAAPVVRRYDGKIARERLSGTWLGTPPLASGFCLG